VSAPALIAVAHGSKDPAAQHAVEALARLVRYLAPGLDVRVAFVQNAEPSLPRALASADAPVVVVPLLLSAGYHLTADIAGAARAAGARLAEPLGPDVRLAGALADRLASAGAPAGTATVLAAAGSADPRAIADIQRQARMLSDRIGAPVVAAYASAARPGVAEAVAALRVPPDQPVAVAVYLLSPGHFYQRVRQARARWVSEPLGSHPAVAALVLDRFLAVCPAAAGYLSARAEPGPARAVAGECPAGTGTKAGRLPSCLRAGLVRESPRRGRQEG
jgi:sirohydrochlorin ferrochelatase